MSEPFLIKNGLAIDPALKLEAPRDVLIRDGKIADLAPGLSKKSALKDVPSFDAKGLWVVPGLIDLHVHLREPGREADETIATGSRAAAAGGFTTILAMPNTEPVADNPGLLYLLKTRARAEAPVNVLFAAAITVGQKGERLTEIATLAEAGASALSDDGRPVANSELMRRCLEHAKDCGLPVMDHCEDCCLSAAGVMHEGAPSAAKGLRGIPAEAESVLAMRDIALAELTGSPVHLCHVSCAATVRALREAKKRGVAVTAEATPHHFTLCDEDIPGYDGNFKMNPPLRSKADREAVLEALSDGTIDAIATDHAPHGAGAKALGFQDAPFGVIGLETALGLTVTRLLGRKLLTPKQLVERMSAAPARILGLKDRGTLKPGARADLTLVAPGAAWTVGLPFISKSRNSPFLGMKLKGRVQAVIVAGKVVHGL